MLPPVKYVRSVSPCPEVFHWNASGPTELIPGCCEPGSPLSHASMKLISSEPCCPALRRAVIGPTTRQVPRPEGEVNVVAGTVSPKSERPLWIDTCQPRFPCHTTWISAF